MSDSQTLHIHISSWRSERILSLVLEAQTVTRMGDEQRMNEIYREVGSLFTNAFLSPLTDTSHLSVSDSDSQLEATA